MLCVKWLFHRGVWTFARFVRPLLANILCIWEIWSPRIHVSRISLLTQHNQVIPIMELCHQPGLLIVVFRLWWKAVFHGSLHKMCEFVYFQSVFLFMGSSWKGRCVISGSTSAHNIVFLKKISFSKTYLTTVYQISLEICHSDVLPF